MGPSVPREHAYNRDDRAARAWNVYQSAFRTLQGYQTGGLTTTDLRNAQNQIQAELQAYATGLASQPANVQQAVRALHDIQRQINDTLAAPGSPADQRFSSPVPYTERFDRVRFGQPITQAYLGRQNGTPTWGLRLGDDPNPVFTSSRPITVADFRAPNGPVQQALTRAGEARSLTEPSTGATQAVSRNTTQGASTATQKSPPANASQYKPGDRIGTPEGELVYVGRKEDGKVYVQSSTSLYEVPAHLRTKDEVRAWAIRSVTSNSIGTPLYGSTSPINVAPIVYTAIGLNRPLSNLGSLGKRAWRLC